MQTRDNPMAYIYTGYLEPWLGEILTRGREGEPYHRIALSIGPRVHARYGNSYGGYTPGYNSIDMMIRYILQRYDIPPTPIENNSHEARRKLVSKLHEDGLTLSQIATRVHRSRNRVHQIIRAERTKLAREQKRKLKQARFNAVIWELHNPYVKTPGRPIDMGGPRDTWIEASPWDNI